MRASQPASQRVQYSTLLDMMEWSVSNVLWLCNIVSTERARFDLPDDDGLGVCAWGAVGEESRQGTYTNSRRREESDKQGGGEGASRAGGTEKKAINKVEAKEAAGDGEESDN